MSDPFSTFAETRRRVFTPGIDTHSTTQRQGNITDEGVELIEEFHDRVTDEYARADPDFFDGLQFWSRSLSRHVIELPDKYVRSQYRDTPYPTFYVVKIDSQGDTANKKVWRDIATWKHCYDTGVNDRLAPVDAWGENAKWCVMRRVYSPQEMSDRADSQELVEETTDQILSGNISRQELEEKLFNTYPGDHNGVPKSACTSEQVEKEFNEFGFTVQNPEVNSGFDHSIRKTCFFDMGGFRHDDLDPSDIDIFNQSNTGNDGHDETTPDTHSSSETTLSDFN